MNQSLYFIKPHNNQHLAHLYEHLIVHATAKALSERKLFEYLDYELIGYTYANYILITIDLDSDRIGNFTTIDLSRAINDSAPALANAAIEISAEEHFALEVEPVATQAKIAKLHKEPWLLLDNVDMMSLPPTPATESSPVQLTKKPAAIKEFICRMSEITPSSLPAESALYYIIATIIQVNLARTFSTDYQYYSTQYDINGRSKDHRIDYLFDAWKLKRHQLTTELASCQQVIVQLLDDGLLDRTVEYMKNINYTAFEQAPNEEDLMSMANLLVGGAGWRRLADTHALRKTIDNIQLELIYGREKQNFKLTDIT